jgi:SNF2 family DNA or RNA helicase
MRYTFAQPDPYAHQVEAVRKMVETGGRAALLMDPGTGKTRSVVDYLSMLALHQDTVRVFVAAPVAAVDTWVEQTAQYAPTDVTGNGINVMAEVLHGSTIERKFDRLRAFTNGSHPGDNARAEERVIRNTAGDLIEPESFNALGVGGPRIEMAVTNLDVFSQRHAAKGPDGEPLATVTVFDRILDALEAWQPHVIVVDESHRIKSPSSNVSVAFMHLRNRLPQARRLILTGTVMPHSPMDVYAQWRFVAPEAFGTDGRPWNATRWRNEYAITGGWQGKEIVGWRNLDDMEQRMAANAIVVKKDEALDLPPTTDTTIHIHLSPRERKAYATMKRDLAAIVDDKVSIAQNVLVKMLRLRQITSGHLPVDTHNPEEAEVTKIGGTKARVTASLIEDLMASEKRLVVFAHFIHDIDDVAERLSKSRGLPADTVVEVITGATKPSERVAIRRRFGNLDDHPEPIILVAQMRTLSLAVNELVTANHAIYMSMSERRDDYVQSRDRLDRIGQTRPVTFHHVVAKDTVDEVILKAHRDRTSIEEAMLAHVRGGGE